MHHDITEFLAWESASNDLIITKRIYIDMAGSNNAGLLLGRIIYWHLPSKYNEKPKLSIEKEGHLWLAKTQEDWWEECRLTVKEYRSALALLLKKNIVIKKVFKFGGDTVTHLRMNWTAFFIERDKFLNISKKVYGKSDLSILAETNCQSRPLYTKETTNIKLYSKEYREPTEEAVVSSSPPPLYLNKFIYHSLLSPHEISLGIGRVTIPQHSWDSLVQKHGEELVLKAAEELSSKIIQEPKRYKNHRMALDTFIKNSIKWQAETDAKTNRFKPKNNKTDWKNPEGAGGKKYKLQELDNDE